MTRPAPVVAIFNTSPDTVDMLRFVLDRAGFVVVSAFTYELRDGKVDVEAFVRQHAPRVVVYDIAPPYDQGWRLFLHIRALPVLKGTAFVLTTTHAAHVREIAGSEHELLEIVGKPYDLDRVVAAVVAAAGT